jgi:hypothetical protein
VPSTQMRCMLTAYRRSSFSIPRCPATIIAQALRQDHLAEHINMVGLRVEYHSHHLDSTR